MSKRRGTGQRMPKFVRPVSADPGIINEPYPYSPVYYDGNDLHKTMAAALQSGVDARDVVGIVHCTEHAGGKILAGKSTGGKMGEDYVYCRECWQWIKL